MIQDLFLNQVCFNYDVTLTAGYKLFSVPDLMEYKQRG